MKNPSSVSLPLVGSEPLAGSCLIITVKFGLIFYEFTLLFSLCSQLKMTTAVPLINNTQLSVNVTTKSQEQSLYQSSGAIVAAIVVGVIIIFTVVLLILKTYNRRMRVRRELEPKASKLAVPPPLGHNSHSPAQQPTVTFIPVDIHMHSR
ncbi:noncompact myelin-associated protein isoform 1-T1 [Cyanocitta cristata]